MTFFTTNVDVCTGSFCFCCTAIVVDAYRREIFEAAVLFSLSWIDRLFLVLEFNAAAELLLLFAVSKRLAAFRRFLAITVADALPPEPADEPLTVAAAVVVVVVVVVGLLLLLLEGAVVLSAPLTILKIRALRAGDPWSAVAGAAAAAAAGTEVAVAVDGSLTRDILATNLCKLAVVGAVGSAFRLCFVLQKG